MSFLTPSRFDVSEFYSKDERWRDASRVCLHDQSLLWSKAAPQQWGYDDRMHAGEPQEQFQPRDRPLPLPTSPFFRLAPTNVSLKTEDPAKIVEALQNFLDTQVTHSVETYEKFG